MLSILLFCLTHSRFLLPRGIPSIAGQAAYEQPYPYDKYRYTSTCNKKHIGFVRQLSQNEQITQLPGSLALAQTTGGQIGHPHIQTTMHLHFSHTLFST